MKQNKIIILDNFYEQPESVRALATSSHYANIESTDYPGYGSQLTLSTPALKARFETLIGARILLDNSRFTWGGFRFITEDSGSRAIVHADAAIDWAAMVYLTPDPPDSSGTGFYRHIATGFTGPPTDRQARELGYADASAFDDMVISRDKADLTKWELVYHVTPRFNRLVLFRGGEMYHAPMGGCGKDQHNARLAHIFFFNAVPSRLKGWQGLLRKEMSNDEKSAAQEGGLKELITATKEALGIAGSHGNFALVPCEASVSHAEAARMANSAVTSKHLYFTAEQLSERGYDLNRFLLVRLNAERNVVDHWIVDGWSLIREHGMQLNLRGARLRGAQLAGANLDRCDLSEADLSGADIQKSSFRQAKLSGTLMAGTNLFSATLWGADLTEADLSRADLRHVDLRYSICDRAVFRGADLWNAYIWNMKLSSAFTEGADFSRADTVTSTTNMASEHSIARVRRLKS